MSLSDDGKLQGSQGIGFCKSGNLEDPFAHKRRLQRETKRTNTFSFAKQLTFRKSFKIRRFLHVLYCEGSKNLMN